MPKIKGYIPKKETSTTPDKDMAASMLGVTALFKDLTELKSEVEDTVDKKLSEADAVIEEVKNVASEGELKIKKSIKDFENTAVGLIHDIRNLKEIEGRPGVDADEDAVVEKVLARIPNEDVLTTNILAKVPKIDEQGLFQKFLGRMPKNKADLKIIQENLETDPMSVIDRILALAKEGKFKLPKESVDGLDQTISSMWNQVGKRGYLHGGGDTVTAGTGITITTNVNGQKVISASGSSGISSINADTTSAQLLVIGTAGTDFALVDNGTGTHTFNLPTASATNRGALSSADWTTFNNKGSGTVTSVATGVGLTGGTITGTGTISLSTALQPIATLTGNAGKFLRVNAGETAVEYATVAGGGITIGTTTITSGTDTKVLFNNAGVVGEYTISGSGNVAMTTSPVFTTPNLGTPSAAVLTNASGTAANLTAGHVTNATLTTALTVNTGTLTLTANAANTSVLTIGAGAVSVSGANTGDQTSVSGNAGTATALQNSRTLWGQSFDGTGNVTGSLTSVGDITGGASNMIIQSGTGASRTLVFKTTTAGSAATTALTLGADQSATFAGTVALGANNLTMTGSLAATGARVTKGWFTDAEITNLPTINGGTLASALGLAITAGKTLTILKTMSLTSADDTGVYTLPTGTKTLVATDVATLSSLTAHGTITSGGLGTGAVIAGVTMTLGSDASYDMYYRNSSGVLTRMANGTTGQVLTATTNAAPAFAAAPAPAHMGLTWVAGDNTEYSSNSTSNNHTLHNFTGLSIPAGTRVLITGKMRKTSGSAVAVWFGLQVNGAQILDTTNSGWASGTQNADQDGIFRIELEVGETNYRCAFNGWNTWYTSTPTNSQRIDQQISVNGLGSQLPTATITSIEIDSLSGNTAVTAAIKNIQIYTYGLS